MRSRKIVFRAHAIQRMFERAISTEDVRPIHVVVAENSSGAEMIVITAYQPDASAWAEDFKRRK